MRKLLIGPALTAVGYATGAYYGADAEQLVHKKPAAVREAVEQSLSDREGTMELEDGKPVPYKVKLDRDLGDDRLVAHLMMDGREGAAADIGFTPQGGGEATLMAVKVHADHAVLREALAGTAKARLAYAPDWMLNLTLKPVLRQLSQQIEAGEALGDPMRGGQSEAEWESSLPPEKQQQLQQWRQYDATRPMTDPDADARRYLNGDGNRQGQ
jgi:hypothetical protein